MLVEKWNVQKMWYMDKPWRAFAPVPSCTKPGSCRCKSFGSWAEAMNYARDEALT